MKCRSSLHNQRMLRNIKQITMKSIILTTAVFLILSVVGFAQSEKLEVKAFYEGYEDGVYYFENEYGESYEFISCLKNVLKEFDLKSDKLVAQAFLVTYKQLNEDDEEEELEIIMIKKITLEKIEFEDEDFGDE